MTLSDPHEKAGILLTVIIILALLGMLVITLILVSWRRFNERQARIGRPRTDSLADAWRIAGERLQVPPEEDDDGRAGEGGHDQD